jgi:hypothetical protein
MSTPLPDLMFGLDDWIAGADGRWSSRCSLRYCSDCGTPGPAYRIPRLRDDFAPGRRTTVER